MDGRLITEMRTAAVSAVATKLLARPEASVLAIIGAGVQARSHLEAMRLVRAFREIRVWSPRNARVSPGSSALTPPARRPRRCAAPTWSWWRRRRRCRCSTASGCRREPTSTRWGAASDLARAGRRDPPHGPHLRRVARGGDARVRDIIAAGRVDAEIGEVVTGAMRGRESAGELTLFKSVGVAVEDVVTADLVYRKARK
mgnify:CR=1 FL=1